MSLASELPGLLPSDAFITTAFLTIGDQLQAVLERYLLTLVSVAEAVQGA